MQSRTLSRRIIFSGIAVIVVALILVLLVLNRSGLPLFGTASGNNLPTVLNSTYASLSQTLGKAVSSGNSVYTWNLATYPDTSIGCPQPGQSYVQTSTDGFKIVITFEGYAYDFRAKSDGSVLFLCSTTQTGDSKADATTDAVSEPAALIDAAIADASVRTGNALTRANAKYTYNYQQFPTAGLGCPQSGKVYAQVATWGWQIIISPDNGGSYDYRGYDVTNFWFCK
jgi:hypothetical protein